MDEIGKLDYYDDAEERNLIQKFMDGDKNARNRFVENRLAQVVKIALQLCRQGECQKRDNRDG